MCAMNSRSSAGARCHLCPEGRISLYCFLATAGLVLLPSVPQIYYEIVPNVWGAILWGPVLYYALINLIIRFVLRNMEYQVFRMTHTSIAQKYKNISIWLFYQQGCYSRLFSWLRHGGERTSRLFCARTMAAIWRLWLLYGFLPLLGVSGYCGSKSSNTLTGLLHAEPFSALWFGRSSQLDRVRSRASLPARFQAIRPHLVGGRGTMHFRRDCTKDSNHHSRSQFYAFSKCLSPVEMAIYNLMCSQIGAGWEALGSQADNPRRIRVQPASVLCGLVLLVNWHTINLDEPAVHLHLCISQLALLSRSHIRWGVFAALLLSVWLRTVSEASANGAALHQRLSDWLGIIFTGSNVIHTNANANVNAKQTTNLILVFSPFEIWAQSNNRYSDEPFSIIIESICIVSQNVKV